MVYFFCVFINLIKCNMFTILGLYISFDSKVFIYCRTSEKANELLFMSTRCPLLATVAWCRHQLYRFKQNITGLFRENLTTHYD